MVRMILFATVVLYFQVVRTLRRNAYAHLLDNPLERSSDTSHGYDAIAVNFCEVQAVCSSTNVYVVLLL